MASFLLAIIYLSFVSLGLPDAILGAAWPSMQPFLNVPLSYAGIVSMIIALGTVVSSLLCDRILRRLGAGLMTAVSTGLTALALLGFSLSRSFLPLCLWAIPYGLGAGSVDSALNNYVALHYASRHMSWLHCMWGLGAAIGPYIMGAALTGGFGWMGGYRAVAILQIVLTALLFLSLPVWRIHAGKAEKSASADAPVLSLRQIFALPGAKCVILAFFCYCAVECTASLWASTYRVDKAGLGAEDAATFGSLFLLGLTVGRAISGFLTFRLRDDDMIRLGEAVILLGVLGMLLPLGRICAMAGLVVTGLGCAPIYPCIIHSTPVHFGAENSQAVIGVQMASAYVGTCLMPPLFGLVAQHVSVLLLPVFLLLMLLAQTVCCEKMRRLGGKELHP